MLTIVVANEVEVKAKLDQVTERTRGELRVGIGRLALKLQRNVKLNKLMGQVLNKRTGTLARSVQQTVIEDGDRIVGEISTNLFYGIGWELGWPGAAQRQMAEAKSKFSVSGGNLFKNGTPKKRSFLATALRDLDQSGEIRTELLAAEKRAMA